MMKRVCPACDSAAMLPPCATMIEWVIARPSPAPSLVCCLAGSAR
jgi:hypothetical protein